MPVKFIVQPNLEILYGMRKYYLMLNIT